MPYPYNSGDNRPNPPVRQREQALDRTRVFLTDRYALLGELEFKPGTVATDAEEIRIVAGKHAGGQNHFQVMKALARAMGMRTTGVSEINLYRQVMNIVEIVYARFLAKTVAEEDSLFAAAGMDSFAYRSGY